ncbi:protein of unknown function [Streptomyces sp. 1222.5]|nr:DUF397 domain-containing protein [Streptomyces sp. 1222.5]PKW09236.1 uncharacterized protein DUF397 [Streptomyces sp. 5112.2]SEC40888.1 protein of unknown function [Streptomyces sp. 1222.5]
MGSKPGLARAQWRRSSYSGSNGGECVEVADLDPHIAVRDSKTPAPTPTLLFPATTWSAFVESVKG